MVIVLSSGSDQAVIQSYFHKVIESITPLNSLAQGSKSNLGKASKTVT